MTSLPLLPDMTWSSVMASLDATVGAVVCVAGDCEAGLTIGASFFVTATTTAIETAATTPSDQAHTGMPRERIESGAMCGAGDGAADSGEAEVGPGTDGDRIR